MKLTPLRILLGYAALIFLAILLLVLPLVRGMLAQRKAIAGLMQVASSAVQRMGNADCYPGFTFDSRGPQSIEHATDPALFGRVTSVTFYSSDDRQVVESIRYMARFERLDRVMFQSIPTPSVVAKVRAALPDVSLVDSDGIELP